MVAGIGNLQNENFSSGIPSIKKSWRVPTLSHRSRNLIHSTFPKDSVIRLEYYRYIAHGAYKKQPRSIELAMALGIHVEQSDYDVMLAFEDEVQAYSFVRYCSEKEIYASLYVDGMMINSPGGLELYLRAEDDSLRVRTGTSGEATFIKSVKKIRELEKKWREQWPRKH